MFLIKVFKIHVFYVFKIFKNVLDPIFNFVFLFLLKYKRTKLQICCITYG